MRLAGFQLAEPVAFSVLISPGPPTDSQLYVYASFLTCGDALWENGCHFQKKLHQKVFSTEKPK